MSDHSPGISIRLARDQDVPEILDIYTPFILNTCVSFEMAVPDRDEFTGRIKNIQQTLPWLVCEYENRIAGYAYAADHRSRKAYQWTKELSVYIHDDFKQKGIATALYNTLLQLLKVQGVSNCLAGITLPNEASVGFHEKLGFKKVGVYHRIGFKFNEFRDVGWWELFIAGKNEMPDNIIPISRIEKTEKFEMAVKMGLSYVKKEF
ncbi:MAG: N-acetyltransferase [Cyclobacteriaceae bacterium]|nr:N-acetyltransferase [Cyclobacteriaceae bacterium]